MNRLFDKFGLRDKIVLLTGATGHLGKAMAAALLEAEATLVIASRNKRKGNSVAAKLGKNTVSLKLDIVNDQSVQSCMQKIKKKFGRLDCLINNAYSCFGEDIFNLTNTKFNQTIDGTLTSAFRLTRAALPLMKNKKRASSIINIASMYGIISPNPSNYRNYEMKINPPDYGCAKAGLIQLTKYAAVQYAKFNIRVNSISPGAFPQLKNLPKKFISDLANQIPMKRIGKPAEIGGAVVYLASEASSYITGHNLVIDGGYTIW